MLKEFIGSIKKTAKRKIPNPPYYYGVLLNLHEEDYPAYLKKMFKFTTGEDLDLKNPKTFNEKIQWLKLYDTTPLKTQLTDKILSREWVKEKIGDDYIKPLLWTGSSFDEIPFQNLPEKFIIKTNHGCKWHYKIKNKTDFLGNERLYSIIKFKFNGWMDLNFSFAAGFELQYKNIIPKILIEPLMLDDINDKPVEYEIYCFNGEPKIFQKIKYTMPRESSVYNEMYEQIPLKFIPDYKIIENPVNDNLRLAVMLSEKLCKGFKLVRVDWMEYQGNIYFSEMTFTPFSGFYDFKGSSWNIVLGNMLNLDD